MLMLTNFLDAYFGGVLQPVYVREVYGDALSLGLLLSANGGGAVIGGCKITESPANLLFRDDAEDIIKNISLIDFAVSQHSVVSYENPLHVWALLFQPK